MSETSRLGAVGEELAVEWLCSNGFSIIARNWRSGHYELDIVASKCGTVHFVEVKLRRKGGLTCPEDALSHAKKQALLNAANRYIVSHDITSDCQIDVIAVDYEGGGHGDVRYIPDITVTGW